MPQLIRAGDRHSRTRFALCALFAWCCASFGATSLRAEPQDRQVAEWAILSGGSVRLEGQPERIRDVTKLPAADFTVELADLVGTNINPPDLARFTGLKRLRILNLPGPMWNPGASARIDYNRDMRHLAGISTLEELTFSYTYLESIKFEDPGLAEIAPLGKSLKVLSLENTQVRGRTLAPFQNLEALDLVYCPIGDEGLKQMRGMTKLRRLLLRDAVISDDGLKNLSELLDLEQLDLGGTKVSDVGVAHLRAMTKLRKLNLESAALTDVGLRYLSAMTGMEELNLYGTRITNAGLDTLEKLKKLRTIDLRYSRVTGAGVDRLKTAVPLCSVTFLDPSVRPAIPSGGEKDVAGQGDEAVARWVRVVGGQAVVQDGALREVSLASTSVNDELLANFQGLKNLRKLSLQATEIGDPGLERLAGAGLASLAELDLGGTTITDAGLASLSGMSGLRTLGLSHTQLNGSGLKHLQSIALEALNLSSAPVADAGVGHLGAIGSLRELSLAHTDVTDAGLAKLTTLESLRRLDLSGTDVGDRGLPHLGKLAGLTGLLLNYTRITDNGMRQLEPLAHLRELGLHRTRVTDRSMELVGRFAELEALTLDYTDVGDKGLDSLAGLTKLQRLSLDSTAVTDRSAPRVAGFRQLRALNLYHTFFTVKGYQQVHEAVPACEILWDPRSSDPKRRRS